MPIDISGTFFGIILGEAFKWAKNKFHAWNFKKVFGKDASSEFYIVYGQMKHRECFEKNASPMEWPYYKPGAQGLFRVSSVVSSTVPKSIKFISEAFNKSGGLTPKLAFDIEVKNRLDISFCSIGGLNNLKTVEVLKNEENVFYDFKESSGDLVIVVKDDSQREFLIEPNYDYALIIKIIPESFPNRAWIIIAGLGEWGTTGAVWFLSNKWKKVPKNKSFGMIVKVRAGQDESAEVVHTLIR